MLKKIVLGTLFVGLISVLVVGAVVRTVDRTEQVAGVHGQGRGGGEEASSAVTEVGRGLGTNRQSTGAGGSGLGSGTEGRQYRNSEDAPQDWVVAEGTVVQAPARGQGRGRGGGEEASSAVAEMGRGLGAGRQSTRSGDSGRPSDTEGRQYPNFEDVPQDWVVAEGTVVQAPADGVDLIIETRDGAQIVVGTGPGYMETQGFALETGEAVQVRGYREDGELKAVQITRLRDGASIALRDESGHPAWAGAGKRAQADAQSGSGGQGRAEADSNRARTDHADTRESVTVRGTVLSVDDHSLVVRTANGQEIVVEGRPWRFAQEQGFAIQAGDRLTLVGFPEGESFEASEITDISLGKTVLIREEGGRPLWAGRGRRG